MVTLWGNDPILSVLAALAAGFLSNEADKIYTTLF
jgi:hypothetical protein